MTIISSSFLVVLINIIKLYCLVVECNMWRHGSAITPSRNTSSSGGDVLVSCIVIACPCYSEKDARPCNWTSFWIKRTFSQLLGSLAKFSHSSSVCKSFCCYQWCEDVQLNCVEGGRNCSPERQKLSDCVNILLSFFIVRGCFEGLALSATLRTNLHPHLHWLGCAISLTLTIWHRWIGFLLFVFFLLNQVQL